MNATEDPGPRPTCGARKPGWENGPAIGAHRIPCVLDADHRDGLGQTWPAAPILEQLLANMLRLELRSVNEAVDSSTDEAALAEGDTFSWPLVTDVFKALEWHGYSRGDNQHLGRAVGLLFELCETYTGARD